MYEATQKKPYKSLNIAYITLYRLDFEYEPIMENSIQSPRTIVHTSKHRSTHINNEQTKRMNNKTHSIPKVKSVHVSDLL